MTWSLTRYLTRYLTRVTLRPARGLTRSRIWRP